jgi:crotonobetainyl-CoA:carnitine CoA-transferase CaiB-like acyl-CoA transferase
MRYTGPASEALGGLLRALGVDASGLQSTLELEGEPVPLATPHRVVLAGSLALLAQGAAVAALWESRKGEPQEVRLAASDTVFALNPVPYLRRNGHAGLDSEQLSPPCAGTFRTRDDRLFYLTAPYPGLREGTLRLLGIPDDSDAAAAAVATRDGEDLERAFIDAGITGALVRSAAEWRAHPQGRLSADGPVVEIERIGDAPPVPLPAAARPLEGIRIADMTHVFAGPTASRSLAEQGADVLHVGPVQPRLLDPVGMTIVTGFGKRSAIIDFADGDGPVLASLLREADVFVQSWRPGTLRKHGFGPEQVAALRPGIIYVSVSCYVPKGPWAERGGFDPMAAASTGMTDNEIRLGSHLHTPPGTINDHIAGIIGAAAIASTLARRAVEGGSWHITIALSQIASWVQSLGLGPAGPEETGPGQPRLERMESPFGTLDYVAPALRYSVTPARYDRPPVPVGSSLPGWL